MSKTRWRTIHIDGKEWKWCIATKSGEYRRDYQWGVIIKDPDGNKHFAKAEDVTTIIVESDGWYSEDRTFITPGEVRKYIENFGKGNRPIEKAAAKYGGVKKVWKNS